MLFPAICALCGRIAEPSICGYCRGELGPVRESLLDGAGPVAFRAILFDYSGRAQQAVHALKYDRQTVLAQPMAALIAEAVKNYELDYDLAVPIPIHYVRRCLRGFNQAELLASALPHLSFSSLSRTRNTRPQVSLSREARLVNLKNAFSASASVAGKRILLVDDVATTGGTAIAAAEALVNAGATGVGLIAFAGNP